MDLLGFNPYMGTTLRRNANQNSLHNLMKTILNESPVERNKSSVPLANIIKTKDDVIINLAAPGFSKTDFDIKIDDDLLTISVDKEVKENEEITILTQEFYFSNFTRSFRIGDEIDTDEINAKYEDGILSIILNRVEIDNSKSHRSIEIS